MLTRLARSQPLLVRQVLEEAVPVARRLHFQVRAACPRRAASPSHLPPACRSHLLVPPVHPRSLRSLACLGRRLVAFPVAPLLPEPAASRPRLASPVDNILLLILRRFVGGYVKPMPG